MSCNMSKFVVLQVLSVMKNEQQSQNLLLKVDPRPIFRNNFLQPETNVFVVQQVDQGGQFHAKPVTDSQNYKHKIFCSFS